MYYNIMYIICIILLLSIIYVIYDIVMCIVVISWVDLDAIQILFRFSDFIYFDLIKKKDLQYL